MMNFAGLRVLALESRRAKEMSGLIIRYGGRPMVAPAMREVPLESNREVLEFTAALLKGEFDVVIFLTGVGTRVLARVAETLYPREQFVAALRRVRVVARGPKPVAALKELGVLVDLAVPEPNTWREVLDTLDRGWSQPISGNLRIAVQEYGVPNFALVAGLEERGARVTRVPVYQWALPEHTTLLREAVRALANSEMDVVLFTTGVQLTHLFQMAAEMDLEEPVRRGLHRCVISSIGPTTSEELHRLSLNVDLQASHPKMGLLVKEASEQSAEILHAKRQSSVKS